MLSSQTTLNMNVAEKNNNDENMIGTISFISALIKNTVNIKDINHITNTLITFILIIIDFILFFFQLLLIQLMLLVMMLPLLIFRLLQIIFSCGF